MIHVTFARVRGDDVPRLRAWLEALPARRAELAEAYAREGTRHELFYLVETGSASALLVLVSELEDTARGSESFLRSQLPLDVEFKQLIQDVARGEPRVEPLFDSADVLGPPD